MAIVNVTNDSFYDGSHCCTPSQVSNKILNAINNNATIIDIGGCSTRPNATMVDESTEWERVMMALQIVNNRFSDRIISLDTFRPNIVEKAVKIYPNLIINDISGRTNDDMLRIIQETNCPYILTHNRNINPKTPIMTDVIEFFYKELNSLTRAGVNDIIIDPGFGFNKNFEQNWEIMSNLHLLNMFERPILVGISRKSMIQQTLHCSPSQALNGTTAAHILALQQGAHILRVHDVKEATETINIFQTYKKYASNK